MTTTGGGDRTEEVVFELLLIRVCLEREEDLYAELADEQSWGELCYESRLGGGGLKCWGGWGSPELLRGEGW